MNIAFQVVAVIVTVLLTAVVNSVEIGVISANRIRVHHLAEGGRKAAQALERLHREQEKFFAAVVLLQSFLVVFAGAVGGEAANEISGSFWVVVGATAITALITALFGDLIPKVLASRASEGFALFVAMPAEALTRILGPIVLALGYLPNVLSRAIFGVNLDVSHAVTEAELRMLIDISAESGSLVEEEAELIDRVFHFGDRQVHEVMTPRTETVWISHDATVRDFYAVFALTPHSRFPVFEDSPDRVVGILGIKDVLAHLADGSIKEDGFVQPLARPPYFVPETKSIGELFREMQASGSQMAIAIDEFGGTAGIVTLEQLLEEMVGQVRDEMRPGVSEVRRIDERTVQVDGSLSVEEARDELDIDIPEGPYDTIAGYVLEVLGRIPHEGEHVSLEDHRITVSEMRGPKIETLSVTREQNPRS